MLGVDVVMELVRVRVVTAWHWTRAPCWAAANQKGDA